LTTKDQGAGKELGRGSATCRWR